MIIHYTNIFFFFGAHATSQVQCVHLVPFPISSSVPKERKKKLREKNGKRKIKPVRDFVCF